MAKEMLNIVDENDNIIGVETRDEIHSKGLLHREVHVYFVTPKNEIIFQHRAKDKDTFPDLLDATVGGHAEIGDDYTATAIKEALEETGVEVSASDLIPVEKVRVKAEDKVSGKFNHAFQQEYVYIYRGRLEDLKVEEGKGLGFEAWNIEKLSCLNEEEKSRFIFYLYGFMTRVLIDFVKKYQMNPVVLRNKKSNK